MSKYYITPDILSVDQLGELLKNDATLELSKESRKKVVACRKYLEKKLTDTDNLFYGINTGFGSLCNIRISEKAIQELQHNLVKSHACGTGDEVPEEIVQIMLLLKIQGLSHGHSGVRVALLEQLINFYNKGISPVIFQQGSLGASGDLSPLAHLSLALIGLGDARYKNRKQKAATILKKLQLPFFKLASKEGLALLNGTQFSSAYTCWCLLEAKRLFDLANLCAAISIDAFDCRMTPFNKLLHQVRPHKGQLETAAIIRKLLRGSQIAKRKKVSVQDPYAFRCVPQVHGATFDTLEHVEKILTIEINAVTDNPTLFPEQDEILSGGNFHAQELAFALDFLAIALAELGSISERRLYQLISGKRELPPFLTTKAGLHSGLMISQYTAASIVSQNKQLCTPASVDSIVSCNGQEDHVSMAANSATKCYAVVRNLERILAIEFMAAMQGLEFRRPDKSSNKIENIFLQYRKKVPTLKGDRILSEDIAKTILFLKNI